MSQFSSESNAENHDHTIAASPIEGILLVDRYRYADLRHRFTVTSLPGHLLHLVTAGRVRQRCNGREYDFGPGSVIWYHEDEWVEGHVLQAPWDFYTVNFVAPLLPPPPFESRLYPKHGALLPLFAGLFEQWKRDATAPGRSFRCHALLLQILADLAIKGQQSYQLDPNAALWWRLETQLRKDLSRPVTLADMVAMTGRSQASIDRACRHAVGESPVRRFRRIRMSYARGLLRQSSTSITQIADLLGYGRIHEFSRDFRKHFGHTPSDERREATL